MCMCSNNWVCLPLQLAALWWTAQCMQCGSKAVHLFAWCPVQLRELQGFFGALIPSASLSLHLLNVRGWNLAGQGSTLSTFGNQQSFSNLHVSRVAAPHAHVVELQSLCLCRRRKVGKHKVQKLVVPVPRTWRDVPSDIGVCTPRSGSGSLGCVFVSTGVRAKGFLPEVTSRLPV